MSVTTKETNDTKTGGLLYTYPGWYGKNNWKVSYRFFGKKISRIIQAGHVLEIMVILEKEFAEDVTLIESMSIKKLETT